MSLNSKNISTANAKILCRELRKNATDAEKKLWKELRDKKYCAKKFYRQYPIYHELTGRETFFIVDFFCFEEKLIIELDGKYHRFRIKNDNERTKILNCLGLRVIRFKNEEVIRNIDDVLKRIRDNFNA